jgi:hypothetical protein
MTRTHTLLLSTFVAALALLRCSLTEDLDSLKDGPGDASPDAPGSGESGVDSSVPGDGGGGSDVFAADTSSMDAMSADSSGTSDASGDTGPVNQPPVFLDGGDSWCTSQSTATFCADFDRVPLPSEFSSLDGTLISLTSTFPSSSPNALLLYAPPNDGTGSFASKLSKDLPSPVSSIDLEFDLRAELLNTTSSGLLFAAIDFVDNTHAPYSVRLAFNSGAPRLEESYLGSPPDIYHTNFSIPLSTWAHIRMSLTFTTGDVEGGAPTGSSAIYVNGSSVGADALSPPVGVTLRPDALVGAVYGTLPHTGWTLRYDNVTVVAQ